MPISSNIYKLQSKDVGTNKIVQSSREGILVCNSLLVPFANETFVSVVTNDDGGCGLHAIWGYPSYTYEKQMLSLPQGQSLGRKQCSDLLDDSLKMMSSRLGECVFFVDVLTSLWNEFTVPAIIGQSCTPESKLFWQMLCEKKPLLAKQAKITVKKQKKEDSKQSQARMRYRKACNLIFRLENEATIVRRLGEDLQNDEFPIDLDPTSRYMKLFYKHGDDVFDTLRQSYLEQFPTTAAHNLRVALDNAVLRATLSKKPIINELQEWRDSYYAMRASKREDNCPQNFNEEAWTVYKDCIQHNNYNFSTSELLMFANLTGVSLVVSTYTEGVFQVAGCSVHDKQLQSPVYVSINKGNKKNFRGHFERIWPSNVIHHYRNAWNDACNEYFRHSRETHYMRINDKDYFIEFKPEIQILEFNDPVIRRKAEEIFKQLKGEDTDPLKKHVEGYYKEQLQMLPDYIRLSVNEKTRRAFLFENYVDIASQYVQKRNIEANFIFQPAIMLANIEDTVKRDRAAIIYSKVRKKQIPQILLSVESAFKHEVKILEWMPQHLAQTLRKSWMASRYLEIVEAVVTYENTEILMTAARLSQEELLNNTTASYQSNATTKRRLEQIQTDKNNTYRDQDLDENIFSPQKKQRKIIHMPVSLPSDLSFKDDNCEDVDTQKSIILDALMPQVCMALFNIFCRTTTKARTLAHIRAHQEQKTAIDKEKDVISRHVKAILDHGVPIKYLLHFIKTNPSYDVDRKQVYLHWTRFAILEAGYSKELMVEVSEKSK